MPKSEPKREDPPASDQPLPQHLFALPEYHLAQGKFVYVAIDEVRDRMFPVLGKIQKVRVEHLQHTRVTVASGEVVESAPIIQQIPFNIDLTGAIAGDSRTLMDSIGSAALEKGAGEMTSIEDYVARVTTAAGTSLNAKGRPLDRDTLLESMAIRDIEFDEDGYPGLSPEERHLFHDTSQTCTCFTDGRFPEYYLHTTPRMKAYLARLPPPSPAELNAFVALMEKKKREFDHRKRHRQLPR